MVQIMIAVHNRPVFCSRRTHPVPKMYGNVGSTLLPKTEALLPQIPMWPIRLGQLEVKRLSVQSTKHFPVCPEECIALKQGEHLVGARCALRGHR
jgi:hypothetical protein